MAEALPCIVWIANADGHVGWCSQEFLTYAGPNEDEPANCDWMPFVHRDDAVGVSNAWSLAYERHAELDTVARLRSAAGEFRWFRIRARPFAHDTGPISQWFGTLVDVHERQQAMDATSHVVDAIMKGYLSKPFPTVAGLTFDSLYRSSNVLEKVGGDWYDVFQLPDGRIGFSLGDVCGHGIDSAVKMGEAKQAIFIAACLSDSSPIRVLERANEVIFLNNHHVSITTALYGFVDPVQRTVTYACAGHHSPILARPGHAAEVLPNHGFPLGVEEHMPPLIREHGFSYEPGALVVLYTDGLIEFSHDIFDGESRLLIAAADAVRTKAHDPASFIGNRVLGDVTPRDDVAILTLLFGP